MHEAAKGGAIGDGRLPRPPDPSQANVRSVQGGRSCADRTFDAPERRLYSFVVGWRLMAGKLVSVPYGGAAPADVAAFNPTSASLARKPATVSGRAGSEATPRRAHHF